MAKQKVSLCVLDLDNTLWDWVAMWHAMFSAKLEGVVRISGLSAEVLKPEFRAVHQRHSTSEYPFAIEELPSIQAQHTGQDIRALYDSAMHAYYRARKRNLVTYPDVQEVLCTLHSRGVRLVAYTESLAFYSAQRLRELDLDLQIDVLYSPEDHQLPKNAKPEDVRRYPADHYTLRHTIQRFTPKGELKPNPDILESILRDLQIPREEAIYIGDSRMKDIVMANMVGVTSVWAKYGVAQSRPEYQLLRDVTHWTDEDVAREREIEKGTGIPSVHLEPKFTLESSLGQVLELFDFDVASHAAAAAT
jgi:FMN phosphatase YigB (HAD superfamily)